MINIHPELARALLAQFPAGIAIVDAEDRMVWLNDEFASMVEVEADAVLGVSILSLPLPEVEQSNPRDKTASPTSSYQIAVKDRLVMISQPFQTKQGDGRILMLVDRGHALVSFLHALASGDLSTVNDNGMLSNEALRHRLEIEISRSRRYLNPLSCIVVRFDERIDDRESTLPSAQRELADMLKDQLRWVDVLGSWDPGSILIVLPETNEIAATVLCTKLEVKITEDWALDESLLPIHWGVSSWRKGDDINRLVRRADNRRTHKQQQAS